MTYNTRISTEEKATLLEWLKEGKGYTEISSLLGGKISKQRVKQIAQKYQIDAFSIKKDKQQEAISAQMFAKFGERWQDKEYRTSLIYQTMRSKFNAKRANASRSKWEFTVDFGTLTFPSHCPILGIELNYFTDGYAHENSVSFDRVNPSKGYINGNVLVVSWRANRIKNDGSAEEHQKIASFLQQHSIP